MENNPCPQCGFVTPLANEICQRCGTELRAVPQPTEASKVIAHEHPRSQEKDAFEYFPSIGPFDSVGSVISPTITLFKDNLWLITKIIFAVFAPFEIFKVLNLQTDDWRTAAGVFVMGLACKALVAPSLIYALVTVMRTGVAPSLSDSYRYGINRLGKLIACALMAWTLQVLGFLLLIVPGIILGLAFELIYPMAALENRGPVEILKRSYNLTSGYRWRILGAGIIFGLLCMIVAIPVTFSIGLLAVAGIQFWPDRCCSHF
jgi:uncharacterized membrane protein